MDTRVIAAGGDGSVEIISLLMVAVLGLLLLVFLLSSEKRRDRTFRSVSMIVCLALSVALVLGLRLGLLDSTQLSRWLRSSDTVGKLAWSLLVTGSLLLLGRAGAHFMASGIEDLKMRHKVRRTIQWLRTAVILIALLVIWGADTGNLGVFLGIAGAGVALSLQELLLCLVGWLFIVLKTPFDIGDRIEVDTKMGDVIDIGILHTTMLEVGNWVEADQSTGRLAIVPNSAFIRSPLFNFTKGFPFIWNELKIVVTFESDWRRAKEIMTELSAEQDEMLEAEVRRQIEAMQEVYPIHYKQLGSIVYTSIADQGVSLTLRYLTPVRKRRGTASRLAEAVLEAFGKEKTVDFAYPTTRFYDNRTEGKTGIPRDGEKEQEEAACGRIG